MDRLLGVRDSSRLTSSLRQSSPSRTEMQKKLDECTGLFKGNIYETLVQLNLKGIRESLRERDGSIDFGKNLVSFMAALDLITYWGKVDLKAGATVCHTIAEVAKNNDREITELVIGRIKCDCISPESTSDAANYILKHIENLRQHLEDTLINGINLPHRFYVHMKR